MIIMIIDSDQLDLSTTYTELNNTQCCHSKFIRAALRRYITHTLQTMHPSMDTQVCGFYFTTIYLFLKVRGYGAYNDWHLICII